MKVGSVLILLLASKYEPTTSSTQASIISTKNDNTLNVPDLERRRRASDWYVPLHPEQASKRGKGGRGGGSEEKHKQFREGSAGSIKKEWDDESYGNLVGSRAHRAYAAAMRSDPKCARFTRRYPFQIAIGDGVGDDLHRQEGNGSSRSSNRSNHQQRQGQPSASASQRYAKRLFREAPPVVWIVQGGSGLGNGLWGFVLAFAQSLLTGRPLVVASGGEDGQPLPSDFLCDAMECQYPRVDVSFAESFPGTMISHGFQASSVNKLDPCLLRAVGCDKQEDHRKPYMCFAAAALHTLLSGRMNSGYVAKLGPLLDRFVGDRKRFLALLKSDPSSFSSLPLPPSLSPASKISNSANLPGQQQQLRHQPQHQDQWQAMHKGVVLHARTNNPASESADTAAGSDAALDAAVQHHQANLRFGLSRVGLCVFEKPTAEALASAQEQDDHRGHQHRHHHRRGILQEDEGEEKSSQRFLQHQPQLQQQHKQHQQRQSLAGSSNNGVQLVFVASDSLELKQRLHELHDHRGAATGGRYELEWFNVSNAHIAAISRTSSGDTAHRDGEAADAPPSSRAANFHLSKLMTFVEFFRLGRASSVIAARLQLDTKKSPLSSEKEGGGDVQFHVSPLLSTFVETAAITGGAALSVCKSQSFGTKGLAERDRGENNAMNPSLVSSSLPSSASAAAAAAAPAPLPSLVDFPSRLRTHASTVVVHTVPLTLLLPLPLPPPPPMQTHSSEVTNEGKRDRRRRRQLLGMVRPALRQRHRRLIGGGGTTDSETTAGSVGDHNHHNHSHNHSHNDHNYHREQHRGKPTKEDADDGLKGQRVGNRATDDKKGGSGGGSGGTIAEVIKGVAHAISWIGGDARHIVFVPCFLAQQSCGHGTSISSTSSSSPPSSASSPLWSELSKELRLLADSTGATIELRPLSLPWPTSSCLAPNASLPFLPWVTAPSSASAPSTPVSTSSSPAHVQHHHPCCALSEASLGPLALALAVTSGGGGGGGDDGEEEDLRPLDDGTLVILISNHGGDNQDNVNGGGGGGSGGSGGGGKKKYNREIGHSASSSGSSGNANSRGDTNEAPSNSFGISAAGVAVLTAERGGFAASSSSSPPAPASSLPTSTTTSSLGYQHALLHYFVEHLGLASKSSASWNQTTIDTHADFFAPLHIDVLNVTTGVFSDSRRQNRSPMLMPGYSTESVREESIVNMLHIKRSGPSKLSLPPKLPLIRSTAFPHTAAAATGGDTSIAASSTSSQHHHSYHLTQLETFLDKHFVPCGVGSSSSSSRGGHDHTSLLSSFFPTKSSSPPPVSTVGWSAHLVGSPKFDQITLPWIAIWESWVWSQSASSPSTSIPPLGRKTCVSGECPFSFVGTEDAASATLTLFASRAGHSCADDLDPH